MIAVKKSKDESKEDIRLADEKIERFMEVKFSNQIWDDEDVADYKRIRNVLKDFVRFK